MGSLLDAYKLIKEGTQQTTGDTSMPQSGPEQVCPKCGEKKCQCSVEEELKGGQVKLDKNKNGKLDADDFKKLRKEDADVPFDPPYTTGFKKAKNPNRTGIDAARALSHKFLQKSKKTPIIDGHEEYTSTPDKLKKQHFGTQVKEEAEQLEEANHRDFASAGMMHPDMAKHMEVGSHMDYYEPKTGDKVHGKVMHKSATEVHMKQTHDSYDDKKVGSVHKFKIGTTLPEEVQIDEVLTVGMGVSKWIHDFVHSTNPKFKGKSTKERQKMALGAFYAAKKGNVKEQYQTFEAEQIDETAPTVHTANYTWGKMKTVHQGHDFSIPLHPEHHEAIAKLEHDQEHKFKDETGRHWTAKREGSDVHFQSADLGGKLKTTVSHASMKEENMKSFKDFITEMEFVNGRYVHKGKYGTSYDDPEGKDDADDKPKEKAVKRGRGRPAGSKSGARQIGGASKKGSGVEYTGYPLHLPNSNKY